MAKQQKSKRRSNSGQNNRNVTARRKGSNRDSKQPELQSATKEQLTWQPFQVVGKTTWFALLALMTAVFVFSYWSVLVELTGQWKRIPDYSHGFLVIPLTILFLWMTRDAFAGFATGISWLGASLIIFAAMLRYVGAYYYLEALHGWSIPIWIAGFTWMFFGWRAFTWSLPAIAFLVFMVPLPYSLENMLGRPLQLISTQISLFALQCLGQPAVAQGTTILLGDNVLEVERACSGLRIFFGIAALAYGFILLFKRPLWSKLILVLAILPIALLANSTRIIVTGLLYQMGLDETAKALGHDLAGFFMIPLAAGMFALTLKYLDKLFPEIRTVDSGILVRSQTKPHSPG